MSIRHQQPTSAAMAVPYYSMACRIGTHAKCEEAEFKASPAAVPIVYESCVCSCHLSEVRTSGEGGTHG
ncbi:hypothetical protein OIE62_20555 [Streptomyces scopuliridis]|uniref:Uncharacterized protein n=1 Tax=Streptomyces scopuliridis TaxID=452529 RepID=A0ACD4ZLR4_9ACTN|nr:hypothetical protein [Streptomyces scopuliridis]WSB99148.1 hypothetical protein OG835_20395 [Streptomyces scopuliridis]WSC07150.1 hypothetical protein OIE62_20555 [Streptomyces scopuliridis]